MCCTSLSNSSLSSYVSAGAFHIHFYIFGQRTQIPPLRSTDVGTRGTLFKNEFPFEFHIDKNAFLVSSVIPSRNLCICPRDGKLKAMLEKKMQSKQIEKKSAFKERWTTSMDPSLSHSMCNKKGE